MPKNNDKKGVKDTGRKGDTRFKRSYIYSICNPNTLELIRNISAKEIEKIYGIPRISQQLKKTEGNYLLPDGNILIEAPYKDERFSMIDQSQDYKYYISNRGALIKVDIRTHKRERIETIPNPLNGEAMFKKENGYYYSLAKMVLETFISNLPKEYTIRYDDGDQSNCDLDNLLIVYKRKK